MPYCQIRQPYEFEVARLSIGHTMPVDFARERLIIARLVLDIMRARAKHYYPEMGIAASYEMQLVATAVFVGHMSKRPMGASELARFLEMPRPTLLRKMAVLIKRGIIVKKGNVYCINPEAVNGRGMDAIVRDNIRRIQDAAKSLSKLDRNVT